MTRRAVSPTDRSREGRSHYRPRREKRRKKEEKKEERSIGRSIRIVRKSAFAPPWAHTRANERTSRGRKGERSSSLRLAPFVTSPSVPRALSIAFCNYSRVYDLVCAPRSVNRATRGPRPIECGTAVAPTTRRILSRISLTLLLRFIIIFSYYNFLY